MTIGKFAFLPSLRCKAMEASAFQIGSLIRAHSISSFEYQKYSSYPFRFSSSSNLPAVCLKYSLCAGKLPSFSLAEYSTLTTARQEPQCMLQPSVQASSVRRGFAELQEGRYPQHDSKILGSSSNTAQPHRQSGDIGQKCDARFHVMHAASLQKYRRDRQ